MTYRELAEYIKTLDEDQLNLDVTIYEPEEIDEYAPVMSIHLSYSKVLKGRHPILVKG